MQNVGVGGILLFVPIVVTLILWIAMLVGVFQIRNSTRETSEKLNAIYKLLSDNKKSS